MSQTPTTTSAGVHWDLAPLFADADAARAAMPALIEASRAFRERWRGRVATIAAPELAEVMKDPYITNRASSVDARRLLDRSEIIDAVGDDVAEDLRGKLGSL